MAIARKRQVSLEATPYYHCVSRCVRRAFLCGFDQFSKCSYEHRREWVESLLLSLSEAFFIDIAAYAVMSNHYHVVLHVDRKKTLSLSPKEVIERWHKCFKGTFLSKRYLKDEALKLHENIELSNTIAIWRQRLMDISWFMRCINERIARRANIEDDCTGRFWEGRFKSQALLDEKSLLACMAYVDLNPIRAKIAKDLPDSAHTSIKKRLEQLENKKLRIKKGLMCFDNASTSKQNISLPFQFKDYRALLEWSGRQIRNDKKGFIGDESTKLLDAMDFDTQHWLYLTQHFESKLKSLVGTAHQLRQACNCIGLTRRPGLNICSKVFGAG